MNDGATMIEMQNTQNNIERLAVQRQLYTDSKKFEFWAFAFAFASPLLLTFLQVFGLWEIPSWVFYVVELLILILASSLKRYSNKIKIVAASVQEAFDSDVFGLQLEIGSLDTEMMNSALRRYKEKNGVSVLFNWYSCLKPEMAPGDAILACQTMNASWSKRLLCRWFSILIVLFIAIVAVIVVEVFTKEIDVLSLVFLFSVFEYIQASLWEYRTSIKEYGWLQKTLIYYRPGDEADIRRTQRAIYGLRELSPYVPDAFYQLFKKRDEAYNIHG